MDNLDNHANKVIANITGEAGIVVENPEDMESKVVYKPNGNEEYKREHQIKIVVNEKVDKVKTIKYQWLNTTEEPAAETFIETCNNNETIIGKGFTGEYYLWTFLETQSGKTNISRSEAFYFNNEGPKVISLNSTPVSDTSFTIDVTLNEGYSKLKECKFYVNEKYKDTKAIETNKVSYTVTGAKTGENNCYIIVTDILGNETKETVIGKTKLHTWVRSDIEYRDYYTIPDKPERTYTIQKATSANTSDGWTKCPTGFFVLGTSSVDVVNARGPCDIPMMPYYSMLEQYGKNTWVWQNNGWKVRRERIISDVYYYYQNCVDVEIEEYAWDITKKPYGPQAGTGITIKDEDYNKYKQNGDDGTYWYVYKGLS